MSCSLDAVVRSLDGAGSSTGLTIFANETDHGCPKIWNANGAGWSADQIMAIEKQQLVELWDT
jgi:hypothetical protein